MLLEENLNQFTLLVTKKLHAANSFYFRKNYLRLYWTRRLTEFGFTVLLIYAGTKYFFLNHASPIWAFTGVALSALYLRSNIILPAIFVSMLISFKMNNMSLEISLWQSLLFTMTMYAIRFVSTRFIGAIAPLFSLRVYIYWVLCCAFFCWVLVWSMVFFSGYVLYFAWLGALNGIVCLTPLCLIFTPFMPQRYFNLKQWPWILTALFIGMLHVFYFFIPNAWLVYYGLFMLFLLMSYARFGTFPLCVLILGLSVIYLSASHNSSLFQHNTLEQSLILNTLFSAGVIMSIGRSIHFSLRHDMKTI